MINLIYIKMKYSSILLIIAFVSIAQQFYGQEKYTIWGELPDHSLDNSYLRLVNNSAIGQEYERMKHSFIDSILVVDGKFHYEGVLSQKPFLAYLSSARTGRNMLDLGLYFIVVDDELLGIVSMKRGALSRILSNNGLVFSLYSSLLIV